MQETSLPKLNKHNEIFINSIKIYKKELPRKIDFPDYMTYTCLDKAYQDFIFKLSEVIDLLYLSKKLTLRLI